jgi:hypothetical protein
VDNDCDGSIDEALGSTTCGVGACARTVQNCVGGVTQTCQPGSPSTEVCDGRDNDCDGAADNSAGPPARVRDLRIAADEGALQWTPDGGPLTWDIVKGDIRQLLAGGDFATSLLTCLKNDWSDPTANDPSTPPAGSGFYYLVRASGCARVGSWDDGTEIASRDFGIDSSPAGCP